MARGRKSVNVIQVTPDITALYGRQSLDKKNDASAVARQLKAQHAVCDANAWGDRREYVDNDISATKGDRRPSYERVMLDVVAGIVKRIVVFHLSRFWRNRAERAAGIEILRKYRVVLVCVEGPTIDCTTAYGRGMAAMLGEVDTLEVELKGERQTLANEQRAEAGLPHPGSHRAFGYEPDGLTLVPVEAEAIKAAYEQLLSGGSLRSIARQWTEAGLRSAQQQRAGKTSWRYTSVSDVLKNPRNMGVRRYHGVEYPAQWPAIVSEDVYRAAYTILTDPDRRPTGTYGVALLSTVASCGVCGAHVFSGGGHMRGEAARGMRYRTYTCSGRPCGHIRRKAEPIDQLVTDLVIGRLSAADAAGLLVAEDMPDVPALIAERASVLERQRTLGAEFAEGDLPAVTLRTATERLNARLRDLDALIAEASGVSVLAPLVTAQDVSAAWSALDLDRQRAVIRELMTVRIMPVGRGARTFRPESVEIVWNRGD
jgi:site-specific DNA recombinase